MNTPRNVPAKPPLTLRAQVARLRARGMSAPDLSPDMKFPVDWHGFELWQEAAP